MSNTFEPIKAAAPSAFYHALLRPVILQILRAQGYYGCSPAVLDTMTELASGYMTLLAQFTMRHADLNRLPSRLPRLAPLFPDSNDDNHNQNHNMEGPEEGEDDMDLDPDQGRNGSNKSHSSSSSGRSSRSSISSNSRRRSRGGTDSSRHYILPTCRGPTIVDVRRAMEECGALPPGPTDFTTELWSGNDDMRGVEEFMSWAKGKKNAKIRKSAAAFQQATVNVNAAAVEAVDEGPVTDYVTTLKKKHNKTDLDSKYAGSLLGRSLDHGEVLIEGGQVSSLADWANQQRVLREEARKQQLEKQQSSSFSSSSQHQESRPSSSGLSSLTEGDLEMRDLGAGD